MYDYELDDVCVETLHSNLIGRHLLALAAVSPPPPLAAGTSTASQNAAPRQTCVDHVPHVHSVSPTIETNTGGSWPGLEVSSRAAFYNGDWTLFLVVAIPHSNLGGTRIIQDGDRYGDSQGSCNGGGCYWGTDEYGRYGTTNGCARRGHTPHYSHCSSLARGELLDVRALASRLSQVEEHGE